MKLSILPNSMSGAGGVRAVIEDHQRLLDSHIFVDEEQADLIIVHAMTKSRLEPDITYTHGIYPTGNGRWGRAQTIANAQIFENIASSLETVAVSKWGGNLLQRYTGVIPKVIHNGIFYNEYTRRGSKNGYVLWGKTSVNPTCDPTDFLWLTSQKKGNYLSIAKLKDVPSAGPLSRPETKSLLGKCSLLVATTKENDSMLIMEAMASGIPVLAYKWGMAAERLQHKQGCYLVAPGDRDELLNGMSFLLKNWVTQSEIAHAFAGYFDWEPQKKLLESLLIETLKKKQEPPKVSIVIPCHNYDAYVGEAIRSAKKQTIPCEVIVVDDGSTDNSLIKIKAEEPDQIIVNRQAQGVSAARNAGIERASGNFIICLDADDFILPDFAEILLSGFKRRNTAICYTPVKLVDENGIPIGTIWFTRPASLDLQSKGINSVPSCCMFRKEWWARADGFDEFIDFTEDANLWLKIFLLGGKASLMGASSKMMYRVHGKNNSRDHRPPWNIYKSPSGVIDPLPTHIRFIVAGESFKATSGYWRLKELPYPLAIIGLDCEKYQLDEEPINYMVLDSSDTILEKAKEQLEAWTQLF